MNGSENKCHHNRPYEDPKPEFFEYDEEASCNNEFGDYVGYKCKHCDYKLYMNIFTEECRLFEEKWNELNPIDDKEKDL